MDDLCIIFKRQLALLTLGVLEVVSPQGTDLVLAAHVPHGEADVLVLHCLYIETWIKSKQKELQKPDELIDTLCCNEFFAHTPIVGMVVTISPSFSL